MSHDGAPGAASGDRTSDVSVRELTELQGKNMTQYVELVNKAAERYKAAHPG